MVTALIFYICSCCRGIGRHENRTTPLRDTLSQTLSLSRMGSTGNCNCYPKISNLCHTPTHFCREQSPCISTPAQTGTVSQGTGTRTLAPASPTAPDIRSHLVAWPQWILDPFWAQYFCILLEDCLCVLHLLWFNKEG